MRGRPADGAGVDWGDMVADCALDALRAPGVHEGDLAAPAYEMPHLVRLHQGTQLVTPALGSRLAALVRVGKGGSSVPDVMSRRISHPSKRSDREGYGLAGQGGMQAHDMQPERIFYR